ncbi:hypothetical protein CEH05_02250 [Halobacillus halophilus]|nr:hypothetical protein CEH05_02250 [Halobacillus halophilus]
MPPLLITSELELFFNYTTDDRVSPRVCLSLFTSVSKILLDYSTSVIKKTFSTDWKRFKEIERVFAIKKGGMQ